MCLGLIATTALANNAIAPINNGDIGTALVIPSPLDVLTETSSKDEIKQAIVYEAKNNSINPFLMTDLSDCENDFRNSCIVDTNHKLSCGPFMFQENTFKGFCPELEWRVKNMIFMNPADNIRCAVKMASKNINLIRQHWVICSRSLNF